MKDVARGGMVHAQRARAMADQACSENTASAGLMLQRWREAEVHGPRRSGRKASAGRSRVFAGHGRAEAMADR